MKTTLEKFNQIPDSDKDDNYKETIKFILSHMIENKNNKIRKFKYGVKVINPRTKEETYYETDHNCDIILSYPVENGKIGTCSGEIIVRDIISQYKHDHKIMMY